MPKLVGAFCLSACVCLGQITPTQAGEIARVRALLQSPRHIDKAWGAHLAIGAHDDAIRDRLIAELRRAQLLHGVTVNTADYAYVESLFDALIRIGAQVPSAVMLPFERNWRTPVLILLSRQIHDGLANEDALFSMGDEAPELFEWWAIGDLLAQMNSQRFYRKTLEHVPASQYLIVRDTPGDVLRGGMSDAAGLATTRSNPPGFPPIGFYELDAQSFGDSTLMVSGPIPVYYRRHEIAGGAASAWSETHFRDAAAIDRAYLAAYLPRPPGVTREDVDRIFYRQTIVPWSDATRFLREAETALDAQAEAISTFVGSSQKRGLGDVTGIAVHLKVIVEDLRKVAREALPTVESRQVVLK